MRWSALVLLILLPALPVVLLAGWLAHGPGAPADQSGPAASPPASPHAEVHPMASPSPGTIATFGGGCFWCVEAVFQEVRGVESVESGYSGGTVPNPTYEQVCRKDTGHVEVVQVHFDPAVVTYPELLEIFFLTHDPTTPDRQGNDEGPQYRSVVFYHDETQRQQAEEALRKAAEAWDAPVVTRIEPAAAFYPAEDYHQDYFELHPRQPYCSLVIAPKLQKFRKRFQDRLKSASPSTP